MQSPTHTITAARTDGPDAAGASAFARIAFAVYTLLIVYASLYPLEGWRDHGISPFAYLTSPWPRYVTGFDLAANVTGYLPYGFLCVLALHPRIRGLAAFAAAFGSAALLSLGMEAFQSYLPARVANNLDVLCNIAGGACGAALGVLAVANMLSSPLERLRTPAFLAGAHREGGVKPLSPRALRQPHTDSLLFS